MNPPININNIINKSIIYVANDIIPFPKLDWSCNICFDNYNDTDKKLKKLKNCGHDLCESCLIHIRNYEIDTCPICRFEINENDYNYISEEEEMQQSIQNIENNRYELIYKLSLVISNINFIFALITFIICIIVILFLLLGTKYMTILIYISGVSFIVIICLIKLIFDCKEKEYILNSQLESLTYPLINDIYVV